MYFDPMYFVFVGPAVLLSLWASARVKSTFKKYSRVGSRSGMTGAQAARRLLDSGGLHDVDIKLVGGMLTDHYHPVKRQLALSRDVYESTSVAAIGVACHEAGHALQHKANYFPMWLRSAMVPVANIGSKAWIFVLIAGALFQAMGLIKIALILFGAVVAFQLVTLPVEFDASARAKRLMVEQQVLGPDESGGAAKVLNAAALTYVASALTSIATLLYYMYRFGLLGGRR